jgi:putative exosortase-associated protein (TIGR04073 family)
MLNKLALLLALLLATSFVTGCANAEKKLGRGVANSCEIIRMGDLRRTMEQTAVFQNPSYGYTTGFFKGLNKTLARTGVGLYEIVTAPIPPYDPVFTDYITPAPVWPDNNTPKLLEDSMFATDANLGFSGGDVAPGIPGSRFRIFDSH